MDQAHEIDRLRARVQELEMQNAQLANNVHMHRTRLVALMQTTAAMFVIDDLAAVLGLTIQHATDLIPGVSKTLIWLLDEANDQLVLHMPEGQRPLYLRLRPGQGLAGRVCLAPRPMKFTGDDLAAALSEHDPADREWLRRLLEPAWPPQSALGAPLRVEQHVLGAMVLFGGAQSDLLLASDLLFVQALATMIANALANARHEARVSLLDQALHAEQQLHAAAQQQLNAVQAGMLQTAKLAAVGQLAASVAHEINNPLYAVRSSLYLVAQDLPTTAPQHEFLDLAQQELGRIARIIARMRDFYKPVQSDYQPTDLNALVRETLHLAATYLEHTAIEVRMELDPALPAVVANPDQIRQVLLNLVLNACDAMANGGQLTVTSSSDDLEALITVQDTGMGIPDDVRARLFEPFFTTKPSGTGLGLSVSYHIVAQHGGLLELDSEVGRGTTVHVRLPLVHQPRPGDELAGLLTPKLSS